MAAKEAITDLWKPAYKLPEAQERLEELKKGGTKVQKHREKLTRNNQKQHDAECKLM